MEHMQKTASTLINLSENSDVKYSDIIAKKLLSEKMLKLSMLSIKSFSAFPVSRFMTNQRFIEHIISKNNNIQIVELGAGFTPHYLNLKKVDKYIEIDFENNSKLKEKIVDEIKPHHKNLFFVSGDILGSKIWEKVRNILDSKKPVLIFSEGVVSQYFNKKQKKQLSLILKEFLKIEGSIFALDDTLRNHPEIQDHPLIQEGMKAVVQKSESEVYGNKKNSQTFAEELSFWKIQFKNFEEYTINYILSGPEMDFVISKFKLIIIMNDPQGKYKEEIEKLSRKNKKIRIWEEK